MHHVLSWFLQYLGIFPEKEQKRNEKRRKKGSDSSTYFTEDGGEEKKSVHERKRYKRNQVYLYVGRIEILVPSTYFP